MVRVYAFDSRCRTDATGCPTRCPPVPRFSRSSQSGFSLVDREHHCGCTKEHTLQDLVGSFCYAHNDSRKSFMASSFCLFRSALLVKAADLPINCFIFIGSSSTPGRAKSYNRPKSHAISTTFCERGRLIVSYAANAFSTCDKAVMLEKSAVRTAASSMACAAPLPS